MELRHLKYFATVARTLNFSDAAKRLFIIQDTLSQQIRQFEAKIGAQLFDRNRHSVTLAEAGEELLPLALKTIEDSEVYRNRHPKSSKCFRTRRLTWPSTSSRQQPTKNWSLCRCSATASVR